MKRINFLGSPMDVASMSETIALIRDRILRQEFTQHVVVNVAKLVNMRKDPELAQSVTECDIINIDGMGVVWGARFLGHQVPERVAGVDLFLELNAMAAEEQMPVFYLGAKPEIVEKIRQSGAKLLFVAITSPKKENFINRWQEQLGVLFVMGVGGTFDVVAGHVSRAPLWMQKAGLEWLYRVLQEPGRMWKRYLITNSRYAWLLLNEKIKPKN
ncbi:UDP-N-acetyl-D-mannosaminuronic acid transferase [Vibrio cholerae]|nr:UDP-N-acetyl-D-mannosaminuronic acid transferase [Vibrio cholerae]GFK37201.1 UDP-N-acetyl-D-mannosaminuronic acid transferase [Vibrio cholerae]GFK40507.1 UDP-N-acetyl-D-mannosaminuronic acid transferase [Vibrio cholerae]GFK44205.1 UDP-N-acetyl-D-mannosaminuronic acid transferase [Vibrio cholerae]GFK48680.1 UDP-N-acetyl-D-mannosaminuronic acid transferase [Vibrio cholerae]